MKFHWRGLVRRAICHWQPRTLVLAYHHVCPPGQTAPWITVSPEHFAEHMGFLAQEGLAAPLGPWLEEVRHGGRPRPGARVIVTVDDAPVDFFTTAFTILKQYGVPATLFVPTGLLGQEKPFWWNRLYLMDQFASSGKVDLAACLRRAGASLNGDTEASSLWRYLRYFDHGERERILDRCAEELGFPGELVSPRPMRWEEMSSLDQSGLISYGAHTYSHPMLAAMQDDQVAEEAARSRQDLAGFSSFLDVFAYPYGDEAAVNHRVASIIREAGFAAGFTTAPRRIMPHDDPMTLGRLCLDDCSLNEFRWLVDRHLAW